MSHRMGRLWATLGGLVLVVGSTAGAQAGDTKPRRAPNFELADFTGRKFSLESFRGKVVMLEFFQSSCPTCQTEAPILEELYRDYRSNGVVLVGISHDKGGAEAVKEYAKEYNITFPLLMGDLEVAVRYIGITPDHSSFDIPRYFLINRQGYIVRDLDISRDAGFLRDPRHALAQAIQEVLDTDSSK
jgi:peroxiredoxin